MKDKTILITGANAGIGKITARELAKMGARVVMVARSQERGEAALAEIKAASGSDKVDLLLADLSSQTAVRQLAADFRANYDRLDVLINNAGALFLKRELSVDGIEMTFALNHLAYFLLTNLLLDMLEASAPARIINVSSVAHEMSPLDFDDLQSEKGYRGFQVYGKSKLANVLFTHELDRRLNRRLNSNGVTVNALHPGFVGTHFAKNNGRLVRLAMFFINKFALPPEKGAETSIYLASSPEVANISGQYFYQKKAKRSAKFAYDEDAARRLWQISEQMTGLDAS